jgi:ABC-type uncharacterized transport system involved in gliding motility auxiliary subunit
MPDSTLIKRDLNSAAGIVLAVVLFFALNIVAAAMLRSARIDLTADRLYTLSSGTRAILARIDEPIALRFYYSERLGKEIPNYGVYATRVREMLQEYESAARGKIRLQLIDPQPFSDEEDRAVASGLQGVPLNQQGELVYFGLAASNSADKEDVIAFFQPERERFLEYDLTKLAFNLATTKKKVVGVLSTLPLLGEFRGPAQASEPWAIYSQLQQFFELRWLDRDVADIPAEIGVLMVAHPRDLAEKTLYAVDQFVLRGGHAIIFVDPHAESEFGRPGPTGLPAETGSNLPKIFEAWGIELVSGKFVGDRLLARRVNAGSETRIRAVDYVAWLTLRETNFNHDDILTTDLGPVNVASAGIVKQHQGASTSFTPLITTTDQAMPIDVDKLRLAPDPVALLADFRPTGERYVIAARIRGPAKTAFPDGPPSEKKPPSAESKDGAATPGEPKATPEPAAVEPMTPQIKDSKGSINLIVVADSDILQDRFWVQIADFFGQRVATPTAANANFVVNAIDNLSGSDELIGLRSRGQATRPFVVVQEIQRDAELRFRAKERELTEKLRDTEKKLSELQTKSQPQEGTGGRVILTKEQQEAIEQFRGEMLKIRKELRDVQHDLRKDIEGLEGWVKFINIGLVPTLVAGAAILLGLARARRRRRAAPI